MFYFNVLVEVLPLACRPRLILKLMFIMTIGLCFHEMRLCGPVVFSSKQYLKYTSNPNKRRQNYIQGEGRCAGRGEGQGPPKISLKETLITFSPYVSWFCVFCRGKAVIARVGH